MKIAVTGKGGVGKTTVSAALATALHLEGGKVIALDADPDANLAAALGLPPERQPTPLSEMHDLIAERTGTAEGYGGFFQLNPKVDDIPETYAARIGRIHLLTLGGIRKGGGGCACPASALAKALLAHLVIGRDDAVVMDMEAGIEHLGRATAQSMDALLIVVDAGPWSRQTARRIRDLASDLGMTRLYAVVNRTDATTDLARIAEELPGIAVLGGLPTDRRFEEGVARCGPQGALHPAPVFIAHEAAIRALLGALRERL